MVSFQAQHTISGHLRWNISWVIELGSVIVGGEIGEGLWRGTIRAA